VESILQSICPEGSMGRFICAIAAALLISAVSLLGQNLMQDVQTEGCIRLWKPTSGDPTKMPPDRQPGLAGVYLLTPLSSNPTAAADNSTYVLTPSGTLNFSQHVGHKVQITGTSQAAPVPPIQETATAPTQRPEEKPSTNGLPRLTVTTMKMVSESCP
jgi:hypothetical protein